MPEATTVELRVAGTDAEAARIMGLIRRAEEGDAAVVLELRKILDQQPHLWRAAGDLARTTESAWLQRIAGENLFFRESVVRQTRAMRRELLGEAPTVLERLLADRVVCSWLGLQYAEAHHARTMREQTFEQGEYYQRRLVRYQRMHLQAIRALATLRRVAVTAIRVQTPDGQRLEAATVEHPAPAVATAVPDPPAGPVRFF